MNRVTSRLIGVAQYRRLSWRAQFGFLRQFSSHDEDNHQNNTTKSGDIRPLFKKIHPDLFATQSEEVQHTNLKCMQSIQELNNQLQYTFEILQRFQNNSNTNSNMLIGYPRTFASVYRLSCYSYPVKAADDVLSSAEKPVSETQTEENHEPTTSSDPSTPALAYVSVNILTPPILRKNQIDNLSSFRAALTSFLTSHAKFWAQLGLTYPYENYLQLYGETSHSHNVNNASNVLDNGKTTDFFKDFKVNKDEFYYDIYAAALRKQRYTQGSNPLYSSMDASSLPKYTRSGRNLAHKNLLKAKADEIDVFFQKHVHVSNVPLSEELSVVEKLRTFLVQYGETINFSYQDWQRVYLVLHQAPANGSNSNSNNSSRTSRKSRYYTSSSRRRKDNTTDTDTSSSGSDKNANMKGENDSSSGYAVRHLASQNAFIIRIPTSFKPGTLIDYLHEHLPCSNLQLN